MVAGHLVRGRAGSLLVLLAAAALPASAQEPELESDRPDFTESAVVVPGGSVQLEGGGTWLHGDGGRDLLSGPELLLRWGVSRSVELRLVAPDLLLGAGFAVRW
jgi:hypothetical protein